MKHISRRGFLKILGIGSTVAIVNPVSFLKFINTTPVNIIYGDISPRAVAYCSQDLLRKASASLLLNRFGQVKELPKSKDGTISFRRYNGTFRI